MTEMQKMGQRAKKASQVLATAGKTKKAVLFAIELFERVENDFRVGISRF